MLLWLEIAHPVGTTQESYLQSWKSYKKLQVISNIAYDV